MDDIDMNIAKTVAMGETISNLAHAYKNLSDEDMQQVVKSSSTPVPSDDVTTRPSTNIVGLDGGKMQ